ncbi:hypothetical protein [Pseudonocardia sp. HH130630-07]|uniref:hypothetical protein n=1 Tax=Pseudonocardia sp. HH130630-07 TaxID=1690815 RepID=UPI000814E257|nr:hypothetical protein [Pseudonocardia sp. HH130630-07]ANY06566.1 hypothetical protein AFB00_09980 [Pseudonocardia sp. HH130630-07]
MTAIFLPGPPVVDLADDPVDLVDVTDLVCPGCTGPVVDAPPSGWSARAGRCPEFSHLDGSVLCPDGFGRVPEPVEAASLRYGLTAAGATAALDETRGRSA